jgi:predicted acyltransferase
MTTTAPTDQVTPVPADPQPAPPKRSRLVSLDALRGFDMFWIIGGEEVVKAVAGPYQEHQRWAQIAMTQIDHSRWAGFTFYDLIFPMFVFIVGVSLVFSLNKAIATKGKSAAVRRVLVRGFILYLLGLIFYGGFSWSLGGLHAKEHQPFDPSSVQGAFWRVIADIRFMGVLQRIAICYTAAGLLFCFFRARTLAYTAAGLLVVYWGVMTFVRAPGQEHRSFDEGKNIANWLDAHYLPGFKWDGDHDPEGLLSTLPAVGGCLLGALVGILLYGSEYGSYRNVLILIVGGAILVGVGYSWGFQFPIIKKLWTSSFVLLTAGCSMILLGFFYLVIDVWKFRIWAAPFVWIGMNAITLYLVWNLFGHDFQKLAARLVGGPGTELARYLPPTVPAIAHSVVALLLILILARFLYKREIFLRV